MRDHFKKSPGALRKLFQGAALALMVVLSMPAMAGERAVKTRVAPVYPELARRLKIVGTVVVEATVDAEGKVTAVKTVSGNRMLTPAAEEAVKHWKFVPDSDVTSVNVEVNFQ